MGVFFHSPYVPPVSSLSHSLSSLHPLHPLDRNGDNIFQQSWTMCPEMAGSSEFVNAAVVGGGG